MRGPQERGQGGGFVSEQSWERSPTPAPRIMCYQYQALLMVAAEVSVRVGSTSMKRLDQSFVAEDFCGKRLYHPPGL